MQIASTADARISVDVSVCVDPTTTGFAEFASQTDLGPQYLTGFDGTRCRSAWGGEIRVSLTGALPDTQPGFVLTGSTDADGQMTLEVPAIWGETIVTLHLEGSVVARDARIRIVPGSTVDVPLTVLTPNAVSATAPTTSAGSGPTSNGGLTGWATGGLVIAGLLGTGLAAVRRSGPAGRQRL